VHRYSFGRIFVVGFLATLMVGLALVVVLSSLFNVV